MDDATKRRWFQFSLRTMFALMTLVAVFVAYHVRWIRQRHDFLATDGVYDWSDKYSNANTARPRAPGMLWLFGETGVTKLVVYERGKADFSRSAALFPEARRISTRYISGPGIFSEDTF